MLHTLQSLYFFGEEGTGKGWVGPLASTSYLLSLGLACFEAPYRINPSCLYPVAGLLRPDQVRIQSRGWALCLTSDHKNTTLDAHACLMLSSPPAGVQPGTCSRLPQVGDLRLWGASPLQARCGSWGPGTSLSWAWHQFPSPPKRVPVREACGWAAATAQSGEPTSAFCTLSLLWVPSQYGGF